MTNKEILIDLFRKNVKGKTPDVSDRNVRHDGREGNWLEEQFGKHPDADNHADFFGYELKNQTTSKTTFGDWSANEYVYTNTDFSSVFTSEKKYENQWVFCRIFGKPNMEKGGRYSWSGQPIPKYGKYNDFGQMLTIDESKDIVVLYSYSKDKRENKADIVPSLLQKENIVLARWYGINKPSTAPARQKSLKQKLEDKFNDQGWFTCKKNEDGTYQKICFGKPMNYDNWLELVKTGVVFFDCGMYEGNKRPYQQWRANNHYWDSLIVEEYE